MANKYVAIRDGGKTNEEGATRLLNKLAGIQNEGALSSADWQVTQKGTPAMAVLVSTGDFIISYLDYFFHVWNTASQEIVVPNADPSNGRIDRIIAYVDLAVVQSTTPNNPDAVVIVDVPGTPAGSPAAPNDAAVQAAVGAGNPWADLSTIAVGAGVSSILNANITDARKLFQLGGGVGGAQFAVTGDLVTGNRVTPYWIAPKNGTFTTALARLVTAPAGANVSIRINKNGVQVATLTINAGSVTATAGTISIPFNAGDYFSMDITGIGSTTPGANLTVVLG